MDWAGSFVKGQVNGIAPVEGLGEVYTKFLESAPTLNNAGPQTSQAPNQSELLGAFSAAQTTFSIDKLEAEMKALRKTLAENRTMAESETGVPGTGMKVWLPVRCRREEGRTGKSGLQAPEREREGRVTLTGRK